jgi:hypothetical protein
VGRLPYQPLVEAQRDQSAVKTLREYLRADVFWARELARLLPDLRENIPSPPMNFEQEKARALIHYFDAYHDLPMRFRIPYLRSLTAMAAWEKHNDQAIGYLRDALELAKRLSLPEEQRQIQAALGLAYEARDEAAGAHAAFIEAQQIIEQLAALQREPRFLGPRADRQSLGKASCDHAQQ